MKLALKGEGAVFVEGGYNSDHKYLPDPVIPWSIVGHRVVIFLPSPSQVNWLQHILGRLFSRGGLYPTTWMGGRCGRWSSPLPGLVHLS